MFYFQFVALAPLSLMRLACLLYTTRTLCKPLSIGFSCVLSAENGMKMLFVLLFLVFVLLLLLSLKLSCCHDEAQSHKIDQLIAMKQC